MKYAAPGGGAYMNEHNRLDPEWKYIYWGPSSNYDRLRTVKTKYDPKELLWCYYCVGREGWIELNSNKAYGCGPLCQTNAITSMPFF